MEVYALDAHALVWFISGDRRLSARAREILERAEEAEVEVLVTTVVLAEIAYIAQKKRVPVAVNEVLRRVEQGNGFAIVPFDVVLFREMLLLPDEWEIHDRIIAATARLYGATLITKDETLRASSELETVWE